MAKRSITDEEIALIKAMLNDGMKNKDIQFFFNRPDRPVNSGRITDILNQNYSDSAGIKPATEAELETFLGNYKQTETGVKIEQGLPFSTPKPFSHSEHVRSLFHKNSDGLWCLREGETNHVECKHEFDPKKLSQIIRAIAALSNNKGGYVLIGVRDDLICDEAGQAFHDTDVAVIMDKIKHFLSPSPIITTKSVAIIGNKQIGFIHVEAHPERPVIVYRDGDKLAEGEILFRYAGQSSRIKFGDLRAMLDDRDRRARMAFVNAAGRLADIPPSNALVIDVEKNIMDAEGKKIFIDEKLIETLKFVKEGEFVEKGGAPTLKLLGEVSISTSDTILREKISREAIFQEHILQDFLDQANVDDPFQYIIAAVGQSRKWLPIFYFGRLAKLSNEEIASRLVEIKTLPKGKLKNMLDRLRGEKRALSKPASKEANRMLAEILRENIAIPINDVEAYGLSQAIISLPDQSYNTNLLLKCLNECRKYSMESGKSDAMGSVFKASCRLDEILYYKDSYLLN